MIKRSINGFIRIDEGAWEEREGHRSTQQDLMQLNYEISYSTELNLKADFSIRELRSFLRVSSR